ncbi:hypothetical protein MAR_010252 [Mya arenaria]|uniref:Uncharacterized protein n=1 Tax=Mya arenaria TaxID=6604 RepID=A0ABY7E5K8_MYAAR|nr:hypothetical protein MAR_010252 [Mya arenaria]
MSWSHYQQIPGMGEHISNITNSVNRNLNFVKYSNIACSTTKEIAYESLVQPTVEHASSVCQDPHEKYIIFKVEMVQRRGAHFVKQNYQYRSSASLICQTPQNLKWTPLQIRRKVLID